MDLHLWMEHDHALDPRKGSQRCLLVGGSPRNVLRQEIFQLLQPFREFLRRLVLSHLSRKARHLYKTWEIVENGIANLRINEVSKVNTVQSRGVFSAV